MLAKIAVLTMTRGRHDQLLGQVDGLSVGSVPPAIHSIASMGDRDLTRGRLPLASDRWRTIVRPVPTDRRALPLAAARNATAAQAISAGADVLVFFDGDVIPGTRALERYAAAVTGEAGAAIREQVAGPILWCGPVLQLPEPANPEVGYPLRKLDTLGVRTPGTPPLRNGELVIEERFELFHALAFAMSADDFEATGGFCPQYTGKGLEDADFAQIVREAGGAMVWVGGATTYLQPGQEVAEAEEERIALNHAKIWGDRWGQPSTHPWLQRLVGQGRLRAAPAGNYRAV
ncbi:MAG: hypothetical protein Q4P07_02620 [Ornithinimicrobium sp.]|uniref:hypothetical protein n=1 Tax=Ornithinimicrobium sp. TaxID=1977084 RepID=UPI0026E0F050|nr:hypothetical protein [Ornithinimicrobium sp.]MDO5739022.1 hypothetical protein [Ornithinimicrobium sp.]